jgi:CubicO group peptidase (beta-lactamase class C family)
MTRTTPRRMMLRGGLAMGLSGCLPDGRFKHRNSVVPEPLDDGWPIATPQDVGIDPTVLEEIHEELLRKDRQRGALGFLVIKDGQLVWETYLHDVRDRDRHHHIQSVTKSVTSLAFGLARARGHFPDLDATLQDFIPERLTGKARNKRNISLEQLLTMRSGIAFDNDEFSIEMWVDRPSDPLAHILRKGMYAEPGERFYYRDADPQVLGYLLQNATGESEEAWTRARLFAPLGIRDYLWEHGPDGVSMAAHGLHLKPRDMGKLGQLLLDGGSFDGNDVLPPEWIELATTTQVSPGSAGTKHDTLGYGYYFWTVPNHAVFSAWGHGGQHFLVAPEQRLVLVKIALPDTDDLAGNSLEEFVTLVEPLLT